MVGKGVEWGERGVGGVDGPVRGGMVMVVGCVCVREAGGVGDGYYDKISLFRAFPKHCAMYRKRSSKY